MATTLHTNNTLAYLRAAIGTSNTTIVLGEGEGAQFPDITGADSNQFFVTVEDRRLGLREIMLCTARNVDSLTVLRAQQGTPATAFATGTSVSNRITAGFINEIDVRIGSVVGLAEAAADAAALALTTANNAAAKADAAKASADATAAALAGMQVAVDGANTTATQALNTANAASTAAGAAQTTANSAVATATAAQTDAANAVLAAQQAGAKADAATVTANNAQNTANAVAADLDQALSDSAAALSTANTALTTAQAAEAAATAAATAANNAAAAADAATDAANDAAAAVLNYLPKAGGTMTGFITLHANPTAALHAAPKQYVDTMLPKAGGTLTGALTLSGAPTADLHAATRKYVDDKAALYLPLTGGTLSNFLILHAAPTTTLHAATKGYADTKLALAGGTLTGPLSLSGAPSLDLHAATKKYVDDQNAIFVPLAGGTMTGFLTLAAAPTANLHAATKAYADTKLATAGGTMTGTLTLAGDPALPMQAATRKYVDDQGALLYLPLAGGTLSGQLTAPKSQFGPTSGYQTIIGNSSTHLLMKEANDTTTGIGVQFRTDGTSFYVMLTDAGNPGGGFNALRPFFINKATGAVGMNNGLSVAGTASFSDNMSLSAAKNFAIGDGSAITWPASTGSAHAQAFTVSNGAMTIGSTGFASRTLAGAWTVGSGLTVAGVATLQGNTTVGGTLGVTGILSLTAGAARIDFGTSAARVNYSTNMGWEIPTGAVYAFSINSVSAARIEPAGTAAGQPTSVMTREKGDLRYTLATSSRRFKDEIAVAGDSITDFDLLLPCRFTWGGDLEEGDPRIGRKGYGLIAEDVDQVLPEAVTRDGDGVIVGLDPLPLIGALVAEVASLRERLETLEAR